MLGDDAELTAAVLAAQDGDEDAFRAVYRAVQPRLLGYIRTLVGEPDAEDVASEAWLQIARDLDRFSGDADRFRGGRPGSPATVRSTICGCAAAAPRSAATRPS